ncbi:hypothetical protein DSO57_1033620 [Entomophthora muscae]|uniref:Uncharacterized protein n=2 Tax=Entomophthora muscae TaxID=34485 RepID=A0ACC2TLZ6_9FUNG|nr:hypothetical protein DSO57_1033620 [Entomophthora muscae]
MFQVGPSDNTNPWSGKGRKLTDVETTTISKVSDTTDKKRPQCEDVIEISSDEEASDLKPQYISGRCLLTRAYGFAQGITLEDLIDKESLQKAIISSFVVDKKWLEGFLKPEVSVCLIENSESKDFKGARLIGPKYLVVHPPTKGFGSMHAKIMLLIYPHFLRMTVGSANLVPHDWVWIENLVYVQDFPRKNEKSKRAKVDSGLGQDILRFLKHLSVPDAVGEALHDFDFSNAQVELVFSIPDEYTDEDIGLNMLGSKVCSLFPKNHILKQGELYYQSSSLGYLTRAFIQDFWAHVYPSLKAESNLKVVFPSTKTVLNSRLGISGAGTIFFNSKNFQSPEFPKSFLCDSVSLREGSLSHCKIITGSAQIAQNGSSVTEVKWFYCGSHNFTAAAWGRVRKSKTDKRVCHQASNYEVGVVGIQSQALFSTPFVFPPPEYQSSDTPFRQIEFFRPQSENKP